MVMFSMAMVAMMENKCQQTNEAKFCVHMYLHLYFSEHLLLQTSHMRLLATILESADLDDLFGRLASRPSFEIMCFNVTVYYLKQELE